MKRCWRKPAASFSRRGARGLGSLALALFAGGSELRRASAKPAAGGLPGLPHFAPKAKRAIYLHMVGAPPQMDLFDYKPGMKDWYDKDLPESIRQGQRLTTMTSGQSRFPIAPSVFKFAAARPEWRLDFGAAALHRQDGGRHGHHPLHAHRSHQSRARDHVHPNRHHDRGQALHRRVDGLRTGQHESGPADVRGARMPPFASQSRTCRRSRRGCGARVFFGAVRRRGAAFRRRSGAVTSTTPMACRRRCAAACWTARRD